MSQCFEALDRDPCLVVLDCAYGGRADTKEFSDLPNGKTRFPAREPDGRSDLAVPRRTCRCVQQF